MYRRLTYLLLVAVFAQLSTGCCLLRRIAWRIHNCHGCYPAFQNPGYGGPVMAGPVYGGAGDCSSCSSAYTAPISYPNYQTTAPGVTLPAPPTVGLPMPAEKKN
jgi:hypothetical protein